MERVYAKLIEKTRSQSEAKTGEVLFCGDGPDGVDRLHRDSIDGISRAGSS